MKRSITPLFLAAILLCACTPVARAEDRDPSLECVNIDPADAPGLAGAAAGLGLKPFSAKTIDATDRASLILWEGKDSADIDDAQAAKLGDYVRGGGNLIVTLDQHPGKGIFRLRFMLPTTAWRTTMFHGLEFERSARGTEWDPAMFPPPVADALHVPYFFVLRPFDTVERGQGRHEPLDQKSLVLSGLKFGGDYKPWDPVFTRPLLNRDWKIRARTDDVGASSLLITGRYGAGSVAVFASSARFVGPGIWTPLLSWMKQMQSDPVSLPLTPDQISSTAAIDVQKRTVNIDLVNHKSEAVKVELVVRILTWENAIIGDVDQMLELPANATSHQSIPMPAVDASAYQSTQFRDAFIVRSGVLSEDGRQIICEQRTNVDLRPATEVHVSLDNIRGVPYPFKSVGVSGLSEFTQRMGEPLMAYAYPPGGSVSGVVRVCNGLRNIAPLAQVRDETQPDNPSIAAINDECAEADRIPREDLHAFGWWIGKANVENSLLFTFPASATVSEVIVNGNPDELRNRNLRNPGEVIVETDGGQVADVKGLDAAFRSGFGLVHVPFPPARTQHVRVRFPCVPFDDGGKRDMPPALGEIEVHGSLSDPPATVRGKLTVELIDAMHQTKTVLAEQQVQINPVQSQEIPFKFSAAKNDAPTTGLFRIEARFEPEASATTASDAAPFMVIQPAHPLHSLNEIRPPDHVEIGFIVTRGFRNTYSLGTGTQETFGNWGSPDDLVWAYAHQLKQTPKNAVGTADHFFVTEGNFKHYAAPWSLFPNGDVQFEAAAPNLVSLAEKEKNWKSTDTVGFGFGDRWDTGPSGYTLYAWQELVQFDQYLASQSLPRLQGKTRAVLSSEINSKYDARWSAWQMARYANSVRTLRDAFAQQGKKLIISGQGLPLVPLQYLGELAKTIMGFSDDSTWGMWGENIPVTTGREMALMAFNPDWKVSEALVPGYDSSAISTRFWAVVGTTESTRRHFFDPGWRAVIGSDGTYHCMNTFGFNMNGSSGYCMSLNDWQESWRLQERLSLLSPEGPLGAGVIVSNAAWDDPDHTTYSGGGMGDSEGDEKIHSAAKGIGAFAEAGVPISFSANVTALGKWPGSAPLILLGLTELSPKEVDVLVSLHQRGVRMVAVSGEGSIPPKIAEVFGVKIDGSPASGKAIGTVQNHPVVATDSTLLINGAFNLDTAELRSILPAITQTLSCDLRLPAGTGGYGFNMGKQRFIVLEDWREEARPLSVRLRANEGEAGLNAVNLNDHVSLPVKRDGADWVITAPTRPGDGTLICVEQATH